ncbi:DUF5668 domain-containing protein [Tibeticola sp.]|uniref:LiaI-LiaF-like domain-containing protein n=1 Tax=Tibeticola sp. TaxID=2005368 RepID=UPI0025FDC663|nr:DUF5668 domain-containing protein [Tibeticola sp.]
MKLKGKFAATVLVVVGVLALGVNLGWFEIDIARLLRTWWPLVLIAVGLALYLTPGDEKMQASRPRSDGDAR